MSVVPYITMVCSKAIIFGHQPLCTVPPFGNTVLQTHYIGQSGFLVGKTHFFSILTLIGIASFIGFLNVLTPEYLLN